MEQQDCLFPMGTEPTPSIPTTTKTFKTRAECFPKLKKLFRIQKLEQKQLRKKKAKKFKPRQKTIDTWTYQPKDAVPATKQVLKKTYIQWMEERNQNNQQLDALYTMDYVRIDGAKNRYRWHHKDYIAICECLLDAWRHDLLEPLSEGLEIKPLALFDYWDWMLFSEGPFSFKACLQVTSFDAPDWATDTKELYERALEYKLIPDWLDKLFYLKDEDLRLALHSLSVKSKAKTLRIAATEESVAA